MLKPKIGLDWDDVTAPFNSIAVEMANQKYQPSPLLTLDDITSWENTGRASVIKEFYSDIRLYEQQSKRISEETKSNIRRLMEIADVYFITAVHSDFMGVRAKQITEAFPELPEGRTILGAAKNMVQFDIVLDDNICNVLESPAEFAVLMRKPWNRNMTGLLSVNNLGEFVSLVEHILHIQENKDERNPRVIALVGPSGSGKNEIAEQLVKNYPDMFVRPESYTTKPDTEKTHRYIPEEEFKKQYFFEKTMYAGYHYGTRKCDISLVLDYGKHAVIPLDMCGAIAMKNEFPSTIIYIKRGKVELISDIVSSDFCTEEKTLRLLSLEAERKNAKICDFVVDNTDITESINEIVKITGGIKQ